MRVRLLLLVVAFGGPMLAFEAWRAAVERNEVVAGAHSQMLDVARRIAAQQDSNLQEAANLLRVLLHVPAIASAGNGECHAILREIVNEHPLVEDVTVLRPDGGIECMGRQPVPPSVNLGDRPWFQTAVAADAPGSVVSHFLVSRISGRPAVVVAGASAGAASDRRVVAIGLNLDWLRTTAAGLRRGAAVLVMDAQDGTIFAQPGGTAEQVGHRSPDHPVLAAFRATNEGTTETQGLDGTLGIYGFTRMPGAADASIMVAASVPKSLVVSALNHHMLESLGMVGFLALFGCGLAAVTANRLLLAPLEKLNHMALGLARGELFTRLDTGGLQVDEFRLLGDTLNHAAALIEERDRKLEALAMRDGLTGLLNRRAFDTRLAFECRRTDRPGHSVAALMVDIDEFKLLNDTYGHAVGDERLCQVARVLQLSLRQPSDVCARYGGEEFVILLCDTTLEQAMHVARRLVSTVAELELPHAPSGQGVVTISIGVATATRFEGITPGALLHAADDALYAAKSSGRNRAVAATGPGTAAADQAELVTAD